jgi:hypothetical protein
MLPVTVFPPRWPGYWGSPFGPPELLDLSVCGSIVLPKGGWMVTTGATNQVMLNVLMAWAEETVSPGTGIPPGAPVPPPHQCQGLGCTCCAEYAPPAYSGYTPPVLPGFPYYSAKVPAAPVAYAINPPFGPPGYVSPYTGYSTVLVGPCNTGVVFSDGQNVVVVGTGTANAIQIRGA